VGEGDLGAPKASERLLRERPGAAERSGRTGGATGEWGTPAWGGSGGATLPPGRPEVRPPASTWGCRSGQRAGLRGVGLGGSGEEALVPEVQASSQRGCGSLVL